MYGKFRFYRALGIISAIILVTFVAYRLSNPSGPPIVILRNFNPQSGFHYNIYCVNHALYTCEQSKRYKLVVLLDAGLYKEDRSNFVAENPYYNKYDWFSYYFEPINQTTQPLSYWKKWVNTHPLMKVATPADFKPALENIALRRRGCSPKIFNTTSFDTSLNGNSAHRAKEFHRIWHQYFKLRPHIQTMVDDFKRKHDFANKYVITLHYRGTDKYNHSSGNEDNPEHPPYEFCSDLVKKVIKKSGRSLSDIVTFVATDEQPFVEHMKQANVNAVFTDAMRSNVSTSGLDLDFSQCKQGVIDERPESKIYNELIAQSVHRGMQDKSDYIKGRDVLVDAILLGSGNIFIRSRGNVSNQAYWIGGPTMECIDLANEFNAYKKSQPGNDQRTFCD